MAFQIIDSPYVHGIEGSVDELIDVLRAEDDDQFLYRGQNGLFGPDGDYTRQIPSLFRNCRSAEKSIELLRQSHLQVAWLFDRVRESQQHQNSPFAKDLMWAALQLGDLNRPATPVPMVAIAQHYGIHTQVLDLTNLDPSAVFATQNWMTIHDAIRLPPGSSAPVQNQPVGAIYRYDRSKVLELGIHTGDLSTGNAGSRPIVQEGRTLPLEYEQDRILFNEGAYEVFLFRQRAPYTYSRPIKPSPLLNEDQKSAVVFASTYVSSPGRTRSYDFSIRDFVVPSFFFSPHPFNKEAWQVLYGSRPDPFLGLGRLCEESLAEVATFEPAEKYARELFGAIFGRGVMEHESMRRYMSRYRSLQGREGK